MINCHLVGRQFLVPTSRAILTSANGNYLTTVQDRTLIVVGDAVKVMNVLLHNDNDESNNKKQ